MLLISLVDRIIHLKRARLCTNFHSKLRQTDLELRQTDLEYCCFKGGKSGELCMLPARNAYCADHIAFSNAIVRPIRSRHHFRLYQGPIERVRAECQGGRQKSG